jgi:hypothetical protein
MNKEHSQTEFGEPCVELFDSLCERRNVLALAYLMHAWPLIEQSVWTCQRLRGTLIELKDAHSSDLIESEKKLIDQIVAALADRITQLAIEAT